MESEVPSSASRSNLDEIVKNPGEILLPEFTEEIEKMSFYETTSNRSPTAPLGLDSIYSETMHTLPPLGLRNAATSYTAITCRNPSNRIARREATVHREAPIFDSYPDSDDELTPSLVDDLSLTITASSRG